VNPDVARAYESIDVYNRGDFVALRDFYHEDIVWHVGGNHALSGTYRGRDALFEYFATVRRLTGGTLVLHPASIVASDDQIAMFTRVTARRGTRLLDVVLSQTFRVGLDGRWIEYRAVPDDQEAIDAFWS
jgi:ketosteroid isomerase-like protein